ncbi:MAG TPA: ABC transporter ATP-binding protein [Candidatus Dormibacteraeota bacterium]
MTLEAEVEIRLGSLHLEASLRATPEAVIAVLGPNGAGKTTLLRTLAGLQPLDRGRIVLDGQPWDDPATGAWRPPERRSVGLVFQDYLLFPHLTAVENVAFGLRARRRQDALAVAEDWLRRVGLADRARARPAQLSGGQAQRVALARALALQPRLLLFDEPLAALDASVRVEIRRELRRHLGEAPGIRVLVTHDPVDALALADRLLVLENGRVTQTGTAAEVTARPRSRYVADLVGVNLWRGTGRGRTVEVGSAALSVAEEVEGDVFALLHPRAVALYRSRPEGTPRNLWQARPVDIDLQADRARVQLAGALPVVAEVTPAAVRELGLAGGEPVWVAIKATEIEVYAA